MKSKSYINLTEYKSVAKASPQAKWDVVYNPTQSGGEWNWVASIEGFIDLCIQKWFGHEELPTLDDITQQKMQVEGVDYPVGSSEYKMFQAKLVTDYQDLLIDSGGKNMSTIIDEFHNVVPEQYASVLQLLANKSADYSDSKANVILLPHSQGNIYANNLYKFLTQTEKFNSSRISIFGYASPARDELGQMTCNASTPNYITSNNDGIIGLSRTFFGSNNVLPSNFEIPTTEVDKTGHGLSEIYLGESYSVSMMNNFINLTTNNCFKDLHKTNRIGVLPNSNGRIIYDKVSHSIVQVTNSNQICEINTDTNSQWICTQVPTAIATSLNTNSITTDNLGTVYVFGSNNISNVIIKYSHERGIYEHLNVKSEALSGNYAKYIDNKIYQYGMGTLNILSLDDLKTTSYNQFIGRWMPINTPVNYDEKGNIFIAPMVSGYSSLVQVYSQAISSAVPEVSFAAPTQDYLLNDMFINNGMVYLCSGTKSYYLPLNIQKNIAWNVMPSGGCSQITGDEQYLFTTSSGGLYKYNL